MIDPVLLAVYFVVGAVGVTQLPILVDVLDNVFPSLKIGRLSRYTRCTTYSLSLKNVPVFSYRML